MKILKELTGQLAVFVIAAILILGFVVFTQSDDDEGSSDVANPSSETEELPANNSQPADDAVPAAVVEEAVLESVGTYTGDGLATRSFENGQFMHEVVANLDDPAEGKFYEGWLVGNGFISTGRLESEGDGEWSLVFTSDEDLRSRDEVVITEETEANGLDNMPEAHVLEGSF